MDIIVVQLMRNASVSAVPIHSLPRQPPVCTTVKRYIDHHYKENITLDQLAEKVSITKYYIWYTPLSANTVFRPSIISSTAA